MPYKIRLDREWACSPLGASEIKFSAGTYSVPDEMSEYLADRCLRSGRGHIADDEPIQQARKRGAPRNKSVTSLSNKEAASG